MQEVLDFFADIFQTRALCVSVAKKKKKNVRGQEPLEVFFVQHQSMTKHVKTNVVLQMGSRAPLSQIWKNKIKFCLSERSAVVFLARILR